MEFFDVLRNEKPVFVLDDVEDKKTKALIKQINEQMSGILRKRDVLLGFVESQLEGDYHKKIVLAKSLKNIYKNWIAIANVCAGLKKDEQTEEAKFNTAKNQLINNLETLLRDSKKLPVVCVYDVFGNDFVFAKKGHNIIVLGDNNKAIIETIINELKNKMDVEGKFDSIEAIELTADYSVVDDNIELCQNAIDEVFANKPAKGEKLIPTLETMQETAQALVLFEKHKESIRFVGCSNKDIDMFERELMKRSVPVMKQLSKLLKVQFKDVCNLGKARDEFATQEFSVIDDE